VWDALEAEYGISTIAGAYNVFREALAIQIPANANPIPAIDNLASKFSRLASLEVTVPEFIQTMILLNKLPAYCGFIINISTVADKLDELKFVAIKTLVLQAWDQQKSKGNGHNAQKLSAVKREQPDPLFQQQQQRPNNNGGGSSAQNKGKGKQQRHGTRGGRGRGGSSGNNGGHSHSHPAELSLGPRPGVKPAWVSIHKARKLAERLDVPATAERLRTLEGIDFAVAEDMQDDAWCAAMQQELEAITLDDPPVDTTAHISDVEDDEDERAAKRVKISPKKSLIDRLDWARDVENNWDRPIAGPSYADDIWRGDDDFVYEDDGMDVMNVTGCDDNRMLTRLLWQRRLKAFTP
ncbi:hypothetical protein PENSPDRAFT_672740, partial [Peniophora sp. CONT]